MRFVSRFCFILKPQKKKKKEEKYGLAWMFMVMGLGFLHTLGPTWMFALII
jgi:hypothetical protein